MTNKSASNNKLFGMETSSIDVLPNQTMYSKDVSEIGASSQRPVPKLYKREVDISEVKEKNDIDMDKSRNALAKSMKDIHAVNRESIDTDVKGRRWQQLYGRCKDVLSGLKDKPQETHECQREQQSN